MAQRMYCGCRVITDNSQHRRPFSEKPVKDAKGDAQARKNVTIGLNYFKLKAYYFM